MDFHASPAFELLYGGAAGGGKTWSLIAEGSRQADNEYYSGILFRRTYPQLRQADGPIDKSLKMFQRIGEYAKGEHTWHFHGGGKFIFSHMAEKEDYLAHDGAAYSYVAFDELAHFYEQQYRYLFGRLRAAKESGVRCYIRAATNPPKRTHPGYLWIKQRWAPWLDRKHPNPAKPGELRWYALIDEVETEVKKGHPHAWSRTFIPASFKDNPSLDPSYKRSLDTLPRNDRMRLRDGDWDAEEGSGAVFDKKWFQIADRMPDNIRLYRFWDMAATLKKASGDDPDFTASTLLGQKDGVTYMQPMRDRVTPAGFKKWIAAVATGEPGVEVGVEQEPGASGKYVADDLLAMFAKLNRVLRVRRPQGDKVARASVWSAQAEQGKVVLVRSHITPIETVLDELDQFPNGDHDDIIDSMSGAWRMTVPDSEVVNTRWGW